MRILDCGLRIGSVEGMGHRAESKEQRAWGREHRAGAKGIVQRLLNSEVGMRKWEKNEDGKLRR